MRISDWSSDVCSSDLTALEHSPDAIIHPFVFDIVHGDYEQAFLPFVVARLGQVDKLINNAGLLINRTFGETSIADFSAMLEGNLLGHVRMIQHLLPLMPPDSHIVNIGSMGGFQGSVKFPGLAAYSASKAALHTLTERSEEHTSELQSLMRNSYAVFC